MELLNFLRAWVDEQYTLLRLRLTTSPEPRVESGSGSLLSIGSVLRSEKRRHPLILLRSGNDAVLSQAILSIERADLSYSVLTADSATADEISDAWRRNRCDCLLPIGDAYILDLSKAAAVCIGCNKTLSELSSRRFIRCRSLPLIVAVPFHSNGEETLGAFTVRRDHAVTAYPFAPSCRPGCVLLDPELPVSSSRENIACAGLDGLCRAIEAYLAPTGYHEPVHTLAATAVKGYLEALEPCWNGGGTSAERLCLMEASLCAGSAATRTGQGLIRTVCTTAHEAAGIPFDAALGIFLPLLLERYGPEITDRLAELSDFCGILTGGTRIARANAFLSRLRTLIFRIGLGDPPGVITPELADTIARSVFSAPRTQRISPIYISLETCRRITSVLCDDFHK